MDQTPITPSLLKKKGFEIEVVNGNTIYKKGNLAIMHIYSSWMPVNLDFNIPLVTNVYVNTWEEYERLINQRI